MTRSSLLLLLVLLQTTTSKAFVPASLVTNNKGLQQLYAETDEKTDESAFVPLDEESKKDDDDTFKKAELLGRGAAKVR